MRDHEHVRTSDFDYDLPPELIAQAPAEPRDASRLLRVEIPTGTLTHYVFRELPSILRPGDLLVINDTRVMAARLHGVRTDTGGRVEALLVRETAPGTWLTLFRPAKVATPGRTFLFETTAGPVEARAVSREGGNVELAFDRAIDPATAGEVPLPPYIQHYGGPAERYQTVYSREARSAAAPTAGLHFTPALMHRLQQEGVAFASVTLDVGPGTFVPVTVDDPRDHVMHAEHITVPAAAAHAIQAAKADGRRVIAVGTTVVRSLEHVARERGAIEPYEGWTSLKILPGDPFLAIDAMITNFHLPKSTLLMLVAAFAGRELILRAYREAVERDYRFYSFGDAMLLER